MSRRVTFTYEDAALLIRAAEKWYEGLVDATRETDGYEQYLADLKRVRALKNRARIGQTQLEHILATARAVPITELRS